MKTFRKIFDLKFGMTKKSWYLDTASEKFQNFYKQKNYKENLKLKFSMTKKMLMLTPPVKNPECTVLCQLKNSKEFLTSKLE